jgi:uncharacterized protein (TIGR02145 family)
MRTKLFKIAQAATLGFAITFTFSCSVPDDGDGNSIVYGSSVTYDGETYKTVVIGNQTWMARNLNYNAEGSVCYDNDPANCQKYGRLYDWATAMALPSSCNSALCSDQVSAKHRGICPSGWHIPSEGEWLTLENYNVHDHLGHGCASGGYCGLYLRATSGWGGWNGGICEGKDEYGFAALPGGCRSFDGDFYGDFGYWWSASERDYYSDRTEAMPFGIDGCFSNRASTLSYTDKTYLYSVRCVQN